jgi:hypothetical protein
VRRLRGGRGTPYSWSTTSFGGTAAEDSVDLKPQFGSLAANADADVERERRVRQARSGGTATTVRTRRWRARGPLKQRGERSAFLTRQYPPE